MNNFIKLMSIKLYYANKTNNYVNDTKAADEVAKNVDCDARWKTQKNRGILINKRHSKIWNQQSPKKCEPDWGDQLKEIVHRIKKNNRLFCEQLIYFRMLYSNLLFCFLSSSTTRAYIVFLDEVIFRLQVPL